jgi:hypothetical protein
MVLRLLVDLRDDGGDVARAEQAFAEVGDDALVVGDGLLAELVDLARAALQGRAAAQQRRVAGLAVGQRRQRDAVARLRAVLVAQEVAIAR